MNKRKTGSSNGNGASVLLERSGPLTIGLDIGYGVVKAVTSDAVVTFPSVTGHAREIKFRHEDITAKYPGEQIIDDDGDRGSSAIWRWRRSRKANCSGCAGVQPTKPPWAMPSGCASQKSPSASC